MHTVPVKPSFDSNVPSPGTLLPDGTRLPNCSVARQGVPNRAKLYSPPRSSDSRDRPSPGNHNDPVARVLDMTLAAREPDGTSTSYQIDKQQHHQQHVPDLGALRQTFDSIDQSRSGKLSFDELKAAMQRWGHDATDGEVRYLLAQADLDHDGLVDFEEFVQLIETKLSDDAETAHGSLKEVFTVLDGNGNGFLSSAELKTFFSGLATEGFNPPDAAWVDQLLAQADKNGDGYIDYGEFVKVMTQEDVQWSC